MIRCWMVALLLVCTIIGSAEASKMDQDYVPDSKTAVRIAEAVLIARYGEERLNLLRPLHVDASNKDFWIVEGWGKGEVTRKGGGIAVWINKQSGAVQILSTK